MRPQLPTLGSPPPKSPWAGVLVASMVIGSVVGGGYWAWKRLGTDAPAPTTEQIEATLAQEAAKAAADAGAAQALANKAPPAPVSPYRSASVNLQGALETAIVQQVGAKVGPALAQVVNRALVWWVDTPSGLMRNDVIDVVFEERENEEPVLHAIRFKSGKNGKTHSAFRFQADGDPYARFYEPDGKELELRLTDGPIDDYDQITSLLRDGRGHNGVDFRAPVGTPVKAPFNAIVKRKNWNFRYNGNCLELHEVGGKRRRALFLHLDELPRDVKVGGRVQKGQVIAASGNSGRSFAPHLHYQLMRDEKRAIDPFASHDTWRRTLPASARAAFESAMKRFEGELNGSAGATAQTP